MTTINATSANAPTLSGSTNVTSAPSSGAQMTQADFLQLMTTQLQAQDPTKPMDNSQFASELAQFSQLSATQNIDTDLQTLSGNVSSGMQTSQVLNSANLVGRQVLVPSSSLSYSGSAVNGAVNVTSPGDVQVSIEDANGNVVQTMDLGTQQAGLSPFSWNGTDSSGKQLPAGTYSVTANNGGNSAALSTYVAGSVTGVGYGGSSTGTYLQVAGIGGVPLSQVAQIN
ncbi:FlgD immunoglobulin-like domain containing protein [Rhodanobacter sp. MP7CTX1]|jgi:flagellar basal-body rod modification protein FlgD|uniref:flagellar hook assembly protein FlgD n=1 Tax=Rhodanobacter sp. MP7CTX1 TaxID=2723084 RepID=UPI001609D9F9|nr:FlgD immunoglobulin-like domain containing protein [Rhodanobacter sp. MP7CTX1]MBB6186271.1 flagellar basal-body rod modification protein FlgD [Rhodanobacter sp. MP7CTX1]